MTKYRTCAAPAAISYARRILSESRSLREAEDARPRYVDIGRYGTPCDETWTRRYARGLAYMAEEAGIAGVDAGEIEEAGFGVSSKIGGGPADADFSWVQIYFADHGHDIAGDPPETIYSAFGRTMKCRSIDVLLRPQNIEKLMRRWPLAVLPNLREDGNSYYVAITPETYDGPRGAFVSDEELDDALDGIDETGGGRPRAAKAGTRALDENCARIDIGGRRDVWTERYARGLAAMAAAAGVRINPRWIAVPKQRYVWVSYDQDGNDLNPVIVDLQRCGVYVDTSKMPPNTIYATFASCDSEGARRICDPFNVSKIAKRWRDRFSYEWLDHVVFCHCAITPDLYGADPAPKPKRGPGTVSDKEALAALDGIDESEGGDKGFDRFLIGSRDEQRKNFSKTWRDRFVAGLAAMAEEAGVDLGWTKPAPPEYTYLDAYVIRRKGAAVYQTGYFDTTKFEPGTITTCFAASTCGPFYEKLYWPENARKLEERWPELFRRDTRFAGYAVAVPPEMYGGSEPEGETVSDEEALGALDGIDENADPVRPVDEYEPCKGYDTFWIGSRDEKRSDFSMAMRGRFAAGLAAMAEEAGVDLDGVSPEAPDGSMAVKVITKKGTRPWPADMFDTAGFEPGTIVAGVYFAPERGRFYEKLYRPQNVGKLEKRWPGMFRRVKSGDILYVAITPEMYGAGPAPERGPGTVSDEELDGVLDGIDESGDERSDDVYLDGGSSATVRQKELLGKFLRGIAAAARAAGVDFGGTKPELPDGSMLPADYIRAKGARISGVSEIIRTDGLEPGTIVTGFMPCTPFFETLCRGENVRRLQARWPGLFEPDGDGLMCAVTPEMYETVPDEEALGALDGID